MTALTGFRGHDPVKPRSTASLFRPRLLSFLTHSAGVRLAAGRGVTFRREGVVNSGIRRSKSSLGVFVIVRRTSRRVWDRSGGKMF
jgi:hypothetical protein